ncbi:hypothetical protein SUGI_1053750 [Cryptomeria japonica]|uniref:uncharacterized protein LOC131079881 n=1 Tax=Cryptomeria japonica TaxID=3369 RepID=UPI002414936F|nr:uncharacterized protein LOC131079881 [Cryptomeria japonica]GLJ49670.1 hypothetical protein SUGI_1053750 [Cryptomeria japonica]
MKSGSSSSTRSVGSPSSRFSVSAGDRTRESPQKGLKDFAKRFLDSGIFTNKLQDWLFEKLDKSPDGKLLFESPFKLDELREFDYALEGIGFQQLIRMPCGPYASTSGPEEADAYFAIEDFLHAGAQSLWEAFWGNDGPMPLYISCPYGAGSKFHTVEKAVARGKVQGLCGTALLVNNNRNSQRGWDQVVELALLRTDLGVIPQENKRIPSFSAVGEALFYSFYMLISRSLSKSNILKNVDCAYVMVVDCQYGGVVKLKGDVNKLDINANKVYECAVEWIQQHAEVSVSSFEEIWNKLGNANWGDVGTRQLLLAMYYSIVQCKGLPKKSIAELAADHNNRLQKRRIERRLLEVQENGDDSFRRHQNNHSYGEIVEIQDESESSMRKETENMKLEPGVVLWLEDSHWQRGFQIHEAIGDARLSLYSCTSLEEPGKLLAVYVGSSPSQFEPAWEDMSIWYQVQRQTKVLNIMKQRGISSKYLPQLVASGRIKHSGQCHKQSPGGRCDHPWCGTPILVTSPVGESVASMVSKNGIFTAEEALRCCHDCLSALRSTVSAGIQHGDISPDHVIRVAGGERHSYYVLVNWGRAVLEERDSPAINLQFSSTYALQERKLCPASDAESLVYLLYYLCGGSTPQLESLKDVLQWRERSWARRSIQQQLGEVSAVLKAFADYVDSLCGTPYPVDYEIWLRRLNRALHGEDHGKSIDTTATSIRSDDVAESSGTSGASFS